jgi:hypothetical protein
VLHLDVSTVQRPALHLDVSIDYMKLCLSYHRWLSEGKPLGALKRVTYRKKEATSSAHIKKYCRCEEYLYASCETIILKKSMKFLQLFNFAKISVDTLTPFHEYRDTMFAMGWGEIMYARSS